MCYNIYMNILQEISAPMTASPLLAVAIAVAAVLIAFVILLVGGYMRRKRRETYGSSVRENLKEREENER